MAIVPLFEWQNAGAHDWCTSPTAVSRRTFEIGRFQFQFRTTRAHLSSLTGGHWDTYCCMRNHNIASAIMALLPDFVEPVLWLMVQCQCVDHIAGGCVAALHSKVHVHTRPPNLISIGHYRQTLHKTRIGYVFINSPWTHDLWSE